MVIGVPRVARYAESEREARPQSEQGTMTTFTGVAVFQYQDKSSWMSAVGILESAGLNTVYEGNLGWLEVCVPTDQFDAAVALLKSNTQLSTKVVLWPTR